MLDSCSANTFCHLVDWSHASHLTSITFANIYPTHYAAEEDYIWRVLRKITSPYVEEVGIRLKQIYLEYIVVGIDWERIDRILRQPNYSGLKRFVISNVPAGIIDEARVCIHGKMPALSDRLVIEGAQ